MTEIFSTMLDLRDEQQRRGEAASVVEVKQCPGGSLSSEVAPSCLPEPRQNTALGPYGPLPGLWLPGDDGRWPAVWDFWRSVCSPDRVGF